MSDINTITPEGLLLDLWEYHLSLPNGTELYQKFWERDLELVRFHFDAVFTEATPTDEAVLHARILVLSLAKDKVLSDQRHIHVPYAWWEVFTRLHDAGLISQPVWSSIARIIYTQPFDAGVIPDRRQLALSGFRSIDPIYFMTEHETLTWAYMPPVITLYRGTCVSEFDAAWQGISWTPNPDIAVDYANHRAFQLYRHGLTNGWPRLIEARLPKSLIFAVCQTLKGGEWEATVDFENIDPSMVQELNPLAGDEIDATKQQMLEMHRAYRNGAGSP